MATTSTAFSPIHSNGRGLPIASSSFSNSANETIDLTGVDDEDEEDMDEVDTTAVDARNPKRPRTESSNYGFSSPAFPPPPQPAYSPSPTPRDRFRAQFASHSNTFFPNRAAAPVPGPPALPHSISVPNLHHPKPHPPQPKAKSRRGHVRQVIDLTSSPSPPPSAGPGQPPHPHPMARSGQYAPLSTGSAVHQNSKLEEVPPRTPVCIGQLTVTALILYPTHYVNIRPPGQPPDPTLPPDEQQSEFAS
ncbi:hypothetical protein M422DRAFT_276753, partial [Sphaerobolus stellatus SS14]